MRNIRLEVEYDGTDYAGWQVQNISQSASSGVKRRGASLRKKTIQEIIEAALRKILREDIKVVASGRTDAGVHALSQTVNFKTRSNFPLRNIHRSLNSLLPQDISVKRIRIAGEDFHSRYSAKSKTYRYFILNGKCRSAFINKYSLHIPYRLDLKLMKGEAKAILGSRDLKSFCASGSSAKTTVRTIKRISLKTGIRHPFCCGRLSLVMIDIESSGFLYNMARNIVGTLIEIGRGRFKKGSMKEILLSRNRKAAGPTASARGLFLLKVKYKARP